MEPEVLVRRVLGGNKYRVSLGDGDREVVDRVRQGIDSVGLDDLPGGEKANRMSMLQE